MPIIDAQARRFWALLMRWLLITMLTGAASAFVVWGFAMGLGWLEPLVAEMLGGWVWLAPLGAAVLLSGLYAWAKAPEVSGDGMPAYIVGMCRRRGFFRIKVTVLKYVATLLTLGLGGSGGVVGPLTRVNAGVGSAIGRVLVRLGMPDTTVRIAAICGAAGALSAVFKSPIGASIFVVEVFQRASMSYSVLFPAILAGATSFAICQWLPPFTLLYHATEIKELVSLSAVPGLVLVGVLCGFLGLAHIACFEWLERLRHRWSLPVRVLIGGGVVSLLGLALGANVLGTGAHCFRRLVEGHLLGHGAVQAWVLMMGVYLVGKVVASSVTISSGMSGGLTGPSVLIGALLGSIVACMVGVADANYEAYVAAGVAGMLAANVNVPIAATVIVVESFGINFSLPAVIGSAIAFQIARSKTIYQLATREWQVQNGGE